MAYHVTKDLKAEIKDCLYSLQCDCCVSAIAAPEK